ncbi:MAG: amino acid permease [Alphaproteobacteria bacterium]|nr:amino acid permease [Alphaproteobacteria bacterium]
MDAAAESGGHHAKLGTFAGVFTPSILTILGIILFLRLGFVVGGTGLSSALLIILLANAISVLTSFSVAAVATNLKVKGGGDYYLISRTLGVGFGGAIGIVLFLAQSVSVGFYAVGFGEAVSGLAGAGPGHLSQWIAAAAVLGLFALAWAGADWASRFQYVVMALIFAALVSFGVGAAGLFDVQTAAANWGPPDGALAFWAAFAIFFPAVTGFTQGISMSGDLEDPGRGIPRGTFLAVGLSVAVYLGVAVLLAGSMPLSFLSVDNAAMNRIAAFAPLIDAGVVAATLSSALASFLGAPRILQALASDDVFPPLAPFAQGAGPANNPRRGVLLSGAIALGVVAVGNLNLIASVVSMFFLVSYGLLNYATYYEASTNSPSFRPTFRFYHRRLSLAGGLACLGAVLAIDVAAGLVALAVVYGIYRYIMVKSPAVGWSDSRRSHHLRRARSHLLAAAREASHPRDWRPQFLLFSADSRRRARLLRFAEWVAGDTGLTTAVQIVEGSGPGMLERREETLSALGEELAAAGSRAFPLVVTAPELDAAVATVIQSAGIGPVQVNTVLANWIKGSPAVFGHAAVGRYGGNLRTAFRLGRNLLVLDADAAEWAELSRNPSRRRRIDVWWRENRTGEFMLLLAHLMTRHEEWGAATVRILAPREEGEDVEARLDTIRTFLEEVRIRAEPVVVENADADAMVAESEDASFVFMPIGIHAGHFYDLFGGDLGALLPRLQIVAMALAAQDVDLGADPDTAAEGEDAAPAGREADGTAAAEEQA